MLVELIGNAQRKGLCRTETAPETAAAFILSALNGLLIEFLFLGGNTINQQSAVAMVDEWLFRGAPKDSSNGGKAVA